MLEGGGGSSMSFDFNARETSEGSTSATTVGSTSATTTTVATTRTSKSSKAPSTATIQQHLDKASTESTVIATNLGNIQLDAIDVDGDTDAATTAATAVSIESDTASSPTVVSTEIDTTASPVANVDPDKKGHQKLDNDRDGNTDTSTTAATAVSIESDTTSSTAVASTESGTTASLVGNVDPDEKDQDDQHIIAQKLDNDSSRIKPTVFAVCMMLGGLYMVW